jgi:hypothetical protein
MEEKDKIFRVEDCESPPMAPEIADKEAARRRGLKVGFASKQFNSRAEGATFCQARRMKVFLQDRPSTTWGSHRWKGAAAILIKSLKKIRNEIAEKLERPC